MPGLGPLSGLSPGRFFNDRRAKVAIVPLKVADDTPDGGGIGEFQYWPETLNDNKTTNYSDKEIPGGSDPLVQWVSGGAREISFTAFFTRDFNVLPGGQTEHRIGANQIQRNPDINAALAWLRQFLYPNYQDGDLYVNPPQKLLLFLPQTKLGFATVLSSGGSTSITDLILCVMTKCDILYKSWFPDGSPRVATADLAFRQIVQRAGRVEFIGSSAFSRLVDRYLAKGGG